MIIYYTDIMCGGGVMLLLTINSGEQPQSHIWYVVIISNEIM